MNVYVILIMLAELPTLPVIRNNRPPRPCSATRSKYVTFAAPIAARASRTFGPISGRLTAQILPRMCEAARASRPGLAVVFYVFFATAVCTAQRFYMEVEEQRCGAGGQDEPDPLSLTTMNALSFTISSPLFGGTLQFYLGEAIFFHDLIAQILPRSL